MSKLSELWSGLSPKARRAVVGGGIAVLALILVGVAVATSGGSGGKDDAAPKKTTTSEATSTTAKAVVTTTTEPYKGPTAPLTGLRVADDGILYRPALAVKVDNLDAPGESAVPQTGLPQADIVFEEIVEGNITRFVALFHSHMPGLVGPVRSARTSDTDILPMFGRTLLAWSGANAGVSARVRSTPGIVDVGYDVASGSYERDHSRPAPHNLYVHADQLWARAPKGLRFPNTMFMYRKPGQKNPADAAKSQGVDIDWHSAVAAPVSWRWDAKNRLYVRYQRGRILTDRSGAPIVASNVVVPITDYGVDGNGSPWAHTFGSGDVFVYTNGREVQGTWSRPDFNRPPVFLDDAKKPILLTPGQTFIELAKAGMAQTIPG